MYTQNSHIHIFEGFLSDFGGTLNLNFFSYSGLLKWSP